MHVNQLLTRQQILDHIWGYDYYGDGRAVDTYIKKFYYIYTAFNKYYEEEEEKDDEILKENYNKYFNLKKKDL